MLSLFTSFSGLVLPRAPPARMAVVDDFAISKVIKEVRVFGARPLEIRLLAGEHVIRQALHLVGPAFSGLSICGAGIKETQLSGGQLFVVNTGGGAPFCLEGVTVTNPDDPGLWVHSEGSPCSVRLASCAICDCRYHHLQRRQR